MSKYVATNTLQEERILVKTQLINLGYNEFLKDNPKSSKIFILSDENRIDIINYIINTITNSIRDETISGSSIGGIRIGRIQIIIKPKSKQGNGSAGKENEQFFLNTVKNYLFDKPINLFFKADKINILVNNVIDIKDTSNVVKNRSKADVVLQTLEGHEIGISIKMNNAVFWESAVSYYRDTAIGHVETLLKSGYVNLQPYGLTDFKIKPDVAIKATQKQIEDVVFGNDLGNDNGFVIKQTFEHKHFKYNNNILNINVEKIFEHYYDVKDNDIHFMILNKKGRADLKQMQNEYTNDKPCYGLYLKVADKERISKNTFKIKE
jgi:hypothetical protein